MCPPRSMLFYPLCMYTTIWSSWRIVTGNDQSLGIFRGVNITYVVELYFSFGQLVSEEIRFLDLVYTWTTQILRTMAIAKAVPIPNIVDFYISVASSFTWRTTEVFLFIMYLVVVESGRWVAHIQSFFSHFIRPSAMLEFSSSHKCVATVRMVVVVVVVIVGHQRRVALQKQKCHTLSGWKRDKCNFLKENKSTRAENVFGSCY